MSRFKSSAECHSAEKGNPLVEEKKSEQRIVSKKPKRWMETIWFQLASQMV